MVVDNSTFIRKEIIRLALSRAKPGGGSSDNFYRRRTALIQRPNLYKILKDVKYVVIGDVATRAYMPERMTEDLDILIDIKDRDIVHKKLKQSGLNYLQELSIGGSTWKMPDSRLIDIIESDEPWIEDALRRPNHDLQGLPVIQLPYLILLKLKSGRTQDIADISRMLGLASDEDIKKVKNAVILYIPEQLEDLDSLIYLGKLETGNLT
jgi:hypothetical protein